MENITIGQIVSAITILTVIGGFIATIIKSIMKWYKSRITDKFTEYDDKFEKVEERIDIVENRVETKEKEFTKELQFSNSERGLLMRGELACLKGLYATTKNEEIANSIKEIEDYMMKKSHNL